MNILWCGVKEIHPISKDFFHSDTMDSFALVNPKLQKDINTEYETTGEYVNSAADFYKALEDLAYDYDGFVLPNNSVFLAHFFYHAGIEMHTDKQELICFVTNDEGFTFESIKILV